METLSTTAGSIGIRPNGTDLSDFRSIRGGQLAAIRCRSPALITPGRRSQRNLIDKLSRPRYECEWFLTAMALNLKRSDVWNAFQARLIKQSRQDAPHGCYGSRLSQCHCS